MRIGMNNTNPSMKMEQTECSETPAYKIQTPGKYPEENIQHSEHGESLKPRNEEISKGRNIYGAVFFYFPCILNS
jgi:hypothetical protein